MLLIAQAAVYDSFGPAVIVALMIDADVIIEVGVVVIDIVEVGDDVVAMV
jgi:hypothetical protein